MHELVFPFSPAVAWNRFSWNPRKINDVTYDASIAVPAQMPIQQAPIRITVLGSWWAALVLVCTTIMVLASSFTAFILYVRPLLQVTNAPCHACIAQPRTVQGGCHRVDASPILLNVGLMCLLLGARRGRSVQLWHVRLQLKSWRRHLLIWTRRQRYLWQAHAKEHIGNHDRNRLLHHLQMLARGADARLLCNSQIIYTDMPTTLNAVERASIEFEELGRNLNMLSGPIRRAAVPALAVRTMGSTTGDSMRRIAQDVTSLTQVMAASTRCEGSLHQPTQSHPFLHMHVDRMLVVGLVQRLL